MFVPPSVDANPTPRWGILAGRVALVTGAASGIGRESALAFAEAQACVIVSDVDEAGGLETVALIDAAGGEARFARCDVTHSDDVAALVQATISAFGRLDYAHNNAGIIDGASRVADCSEADWDRVIAVNLTGVWHCLKHELLTMVARGARGAIVNTSSVAGVRCQRAEPCLRGQQTRRGRTDAEGGAGVCGGWHPRQRHLSRLGANAVARGSTGRPGGRGEAGQGCAAGSARDAAGGGGGRRLALL